MWSEGSAPGTTNETEGYQGRHGRQKGCSELLASDRASKHHEMALVAAVLAGVEFEVTEWECQALAKRRQGQRPGRRLECWRLGLALGTVPVRGTGYGGNSCGRATDAAWTACTVLDAWVGEEAGALFWGSVRLAARACAAGPGRLWEGF